MGPVEEKGAETVHPPLTNSFVRKEEREAATRPPPAPPGTPECVFIFVAPAPACGVMLPDRDSSLRLATHEEHEIGILARLDARTFIGDDQG